MASNIISIKTDELGINGGGSMKIFKRFEKFIFSYRILVGGTLQICVWEIPQNVVYFEIFLHWFKCMNYSWYDIKNISKNTTGNTIYPLYLGQ